MPMLSGSAALGTGLSGALYTKLTTLGYFSAGVPGQQFCDAIADAVVTYLKANASVVVASVAGVTTGPGVSGPGTGTLT